ncbi:hypothetical protein BP6252_12482 [Coleophoma cylindrospora]|uniref:Uncharacterized protein n=1 Tax=Coleophoma cylindrospora TaxID=1849047 RepID=A0A3D8QH44_9HELO|nr:hypothetical protein BP6252_12482 [Coleophoma cylindrospora]
MHKSASTSTHNGLFPKRTTLFGGGGSKTPTSSFPSVRASTYTSLATRPNTSSGSPSTHSESTYSAFSSRASSSIPKSPKNTIRGRQNSTSVDTNLTTVPVKSLSERARANSASATHRRAAHDLERDNPPLPAHSLSKRVPGQGHQQRTSTDSYNKVLDIAEAVISPASISSTAPYSNMLVRPQTGYQSISGSNGMAVNGPASPTLESITYQHIQEMASKRISTLDYLRKAHEGRVYWFNTLLFNKPDLQRMPYFDSRKLARRATNYLLLGLSLPTIIDLNGSNAQEFLKALNALLAEFESYQQIHPPDGSTSLSRGRFPQMFKRATTTASKGRRTSSAADIGLPMGNDHDMKSANGSSGGPSSATSFPVSETDLLPGEEYIHLLTPSLPFEPDFYETFATLCDVLIDCYTKLMSLVASPKECNPYLAEMFTKADARVRKIIVQGVVKEFEDSSRSGVRSEVAGVGKVVLGGLM